ncbi:MAG: helix-turn-helix transcriptional regulator [Ktedonobacteraceae bacterium]|nr:helix-turn-helix transcriptional regulator [Ktedonobacteraceae bacterium]
MLRLRIKEVAHEKKFSQGRLARAADVASNTVRAIYRNPYHKVSIVTINKLAKALDVPVTELIEDVTEDFARAEQEQIGNDEEEDD